MGGAKLGKTPADERKRVSHLTLVRKLKRDCRCAQLDVKETGLVMWTKDSVAPSRLPEFVATYSALPLLTPERLTLEKTEALRKRLNRRRNLATLIVGVRVDDADSARIENLMFLLKWIGFYYGDAFDVLLVEQGARQQLFPAEQGFGKAVRYEFLYNPEEYNRGWGYNVAVKRFCNSAQVVALLDTDVLPGANFVDEIVGCYERYDAVSPYQNIYYSDENEAISLKRSMGFEGLDDVGKIKNPVTVSGGVLIIKRSTYLALKGFEQYVGYGCEDRAMDVALFNHVPAEKIRIAPCAYVHLHHRKDDSARKRFKEIYSHLVENYGCTYHPGLGPFEFIHKNCQHVSPARTLKLMQLRVESFGDPGLYKSGASLSINGVDGRGRDRRGRVDRGAFVVWPDEGVDLSSFSEKELFKGAPDPDTLELSQFYNAYKGKRCFIIGNGPSLNKHDLSFLEGEYTFGVNSFYYKTRETGFTPFFYVVEDSSVMKENLDEIRAYDAPFKFFPTNYKSLGLKSPNTFFFRMNRGFYEKSSPNYVVPRFSTNAADVLYCGQSVTYINLQLAYFMGFEEVYLIGMDFSYVIPSSHKRTGDVLLSDTDDPNHFHKDYFGKGKTWKDPKLERVAHNYRMAKLVYESVGRRVFNATIGGSLELFPRVDYGALFGASRGSAGFVQASSLFQMANEKYRRREYGEAMRIYVELAQAGSGFAGYKRSAVDAYLRAMEEGQVCPPEAEAYVRGLVVGM